MNLNLDDRASASIIVGALGGTGLWLAHGAAKAIGIPRLLIYMALTGVAAYLIDLITEQLPPAPERWIGRPDEGPK